MNEGRALMVDGCFTLPSRVSKPAIEQGRYAGLNCRRYFNYDYRALLALSGLDHLALDHSFLGNSLKGTANLPNTKGEKK